MSLFLLSLPERLGLHPNLFWGETGERKKERKRKEREKEKERERERKRERKERG